MRLSHWVSCFSHHVNSFLSWQINCDIFKVLLLHLIEVLKVLSIGLVKLIIKVGRGWLLVKLGRGLLKLNGLLGVHSLINDGWCWHSFLLITWINKLKVVALLDILTWSMLHVLSLGNFGSELIWDLRSQKGLCSLWVIAWSLGLQGAITWIWSWRNELGSIDVHVWQRRKRFRLRSSLLLTLIMLHLLKLLGHLLFQMLLL